MKNELLKIGYDGANSTLLELIKDNSTLIYARLIGYKSTNKAIWSALHNHSLSISDLPDSRQAGGSNVYKGYEKKYFSYSKQLPSGLSEMIICSELALPTRIPETAETFYIISRIHPVRNEQLPVSNRARKPDYNLFFELLNKISKVPLRKEWSEYLFNEILKETQDADNYVYCGITELKNSVGVHGWKVEYSEEQLLKHIQSGLKNKVLEFSEAKDGTT